MEDCEEKYELGSIVTATRTFNRETITGEFGGFHLLDKSNPKSIVGVVHTPNGSYDVEPNSIKSVISEDEKIIKILTTIVKGACDDFGIKYKGIEITEEKLLAWIEKQDPKKHEEELENAYKCADEVQYRRGYEDAKREFKKQGEQKPAWSEEDEDYYDAIIAKLEVTQDDALLTDNQMEFLKSLKERYTWKPSDEQMKALNYVVNLMASSESPTENDYYYNVFKAMRTQLKKLMEE